MNGEARSIRVLPDSLGDEPIQGSQVLHHIRRFRIFSGVMLLDQRRKVAGAHPAVSWQEKTKRRYAMENSLLLPFLERIDVNRHHSSGFAFLSSQNPMP